MRNFSIDLIWAKIQIAITAIGGWLGYFLGGIDGLMIALLIFMTLDYITGVMCAIVDKKLSSARRLQGCLQEGAHPVHGGHCEHRRSACDRLRQCASRRGDCLLSLQRGTQPAGKRSLHRLPIPDKLKAVLEQLHDRDKKEGKDDTTDQGDGE